MHIKLDLDEQISLLCSNDILKRKDTTDMKKSPFP